MKTIRLGMIGTGRITNRFIWECAEVPHVDLTAVYNPHKGRAAAYVRANSILRGCMPTEDWSVFLEKVDAVYIAAPHETHYAYAKQALESGKHVLCEKPMCLLGQQATELFTLARKQGLLLAEAVKTAYCPGFQGILKLVRSGKIGTVHDVEACFSRLGNSALREVWNVEYGGSFLEFGTYSMLPALKLLGLKNERTAFWSLPAQTGVDSYTKATFTYGNAVATAKTGIGVKSEGQLVIAGSNGYILVPSPWWLTHRVEIHYENPNATEIYEYPFEGSGLRYEIASFVKRILELEETKKHAENPEIFETIWGRIAGRDGVTPEESIWLACQMEGFEKHRKEITVPKTSKEQVKIWAHRGCCYRYPENTLAAFEAAAKLEGLTGIELDVQLTKDGEIVVIHDEKVDRTTTGSGYVKDYLFAELRNLCITGSERSEAYRSEDGKTLTIPTLREVFDLLAPYCRKSGLLVNIELKNSSIRYEGMEQKVLDMVAEYGLEDYIIYSSFLHESMGLIKNLLPSAQTGILASNVHDCMRGAAANNSDALHPARTGLDINRNLQSDADWQGVPVRAWGVEEPFYGQDKKMPEKDMRDYAVFGVTDIITNVPERYLDREIKS